MLHRRLRSEEHTSELQSQFHLVCRLLLEKNNIETLFSMPNQANIAACARSSARNRLSAAGRNKAATKSVSVASYGSFTANQLVRTLASRAALMAYRSIRPRYDSSAAVSCSPGGNVPTSV